MAVQTGFSELYSLMNSTDQLLQYEIAQNNTIICYLGKIAQQTCALLNEAALAAAAQQAMRTDIHDLKQLFESAIPGQGAVLNKTAACSNQRKAQVEKNVHRRCRSRRASSRSAKSQARSRKAAGQ